MTDPLRNAMVGIGRSSQSVQGKGTAKIIPGIARAAHDSITFQLQRFCVGTLKMPPQPCFYVRFSTVSLVSGTGENCELWIEASVKERHPITIEDPQAYTCRLFKLVYVRYRMSGDVTKQLTYCKTIIMPKALHGGAECINYALACANIGSNELNKCVADFARVGVQKPVR